MAEIGKYNLLRIVKEVDFGLYLDGGEYGEILLPKRYVPDNSNIDDEIEVFIYLDSNDRIIATTEEPFATVNEFAYLKVIAVNNIGAFLDWGLPKDLLVPFREQKQKMKQGSSYPVFIYFDSESQRLAASAKLDKFLDNLPHEYSPGQKVALFIAEETELGYKAIINNKHWGIIYKNEVFRPIHPGQKLSGFIKKVRDDEKIDLSLEIQGHEKIDSLSQSILDYLQNSGGYSPLNDKSPPEEIYKIFGMSKKTFKKAIGNLYKQKLITISPKGIKIL